MPNRLIHETSPYLHQHAHNPVDWYPWGTEAFEKAKRENKPILLSVGYSACHWCHVMERESFENEAIAKLMNDHFVSIKVDREERPDVDKIYMDAVTAMTGHGGWPMTVFLDTNGVPFYGGTYFPPDEGRGMPSFPRVLLSVANAYHEEADKIAGNAATVRESLQGNPFGEIPPRELHLGILDLAAARTAQGFDQANGGWGQAPKFPAPMTLEFLLRTWARTGSAQALDMVNRTLSKMARGGIYDQLGGGFHRYATDAHWLVPHFEKMLYDNAQLARVYLHAYQATGNPLYRKVTEETLEYLRREMLDSAGGFYASQDADSEGEEGKFFVWTPAEVERLLGPELSRLFNTYFDVTRRGNFEGRNILHIPRDLDVVAAQLGATEEEVRQAAETGRWRLFTARAGRVHPGRDDKVLTAWNGMALAAFAEAGKVLERKDLLEIAVRNAEFLLTHLRKPDGSLLRVWSPSSLTGGEPQAKVDAFLEDYALLADGLLALYQATFAPRWFVAARSLMDRVMERFAAPDGGFYDTPSDAELLITRPRDLFDNATPGGNSVAAENLLTLALFTGEGKYESKALDVLHSVSGALERYPSGFGRMLGALAFYLAQPREIALVGDPQDAATHALLHVLNEGYQPFQVVALRSPTDEALGQVIPLLADRPQVADKATAYVCRRFTCLAPLTEPQALREQIKT